MEGVPVKGALVTFTLNGTVVQKTTNGEGIVGVDVLWSDFVSPVAGTAIKKGYKELEYEVAIDEFGNLLDELPPMERLDKDEVEPSTTWIWIALVAIIVAVAVTVLWRTRR